MLGISFRQGLVLFCLFCCQKLNTKGFIYQVLVFKKQLLAHSPLQSALYFCILVLLFTCEKTDDRRVQLNIYEATIRDKISRDSLPWRASLTFCQLKKGKRFSFPSPFKQCCATVWATCTKQQTPQLWMEGRRRAVNCFVLWSYPVWGQCFNNFVTDCRF